MPEIKTVTRRFESKRFDLNECEHFLKAVKIDFTLRIRDRLKMFPSLTF